MNNSALRAVNTDFQDTAIVSAIRPLNSDFASFGEALYSYINGAGYQDPDTKTANVPMCRAFCEALLLPFIQFETSRGILGSEHYFESDVWIHDYLADNGYTRMGFGNFIKLDEGNRPIVLASVCGNNYQNVEISFYGAEEHVMAARAETIKHVCSEEAVEERPWYYEVQMGRSMTGDKALTLRHSVIENSRTTMPAYYPYLDGGVEVLIRDFMESDETVLILMGPPGTGKSSAIMAAAEHMNMMPIYAKKTDVIMDKTFVSYVFGASDEWMAKIAGTNARRRIDLFKERVTEEREFEANVSPYRKKDEEKEPRVPFVVVEDADALLAPRSSGNLAMGELLNETDGISSNHTRKIIFSTNLSSERDIDEALVRDGRCYGVINFRLLTPEEAIIARDAAGLPPFETIPTGNVSLATAMRKPRKRISLSSGKSTIGFIS